MSLLRYFLIIFLSLTIPLASCRRSSESDAERDLESAKNEGSMKVADPHEPDVLKGLENEEKRGSMKVVDPLEGHLVGERVQSGEEPVAKKRKFRLRRPPKKINGTGELIENSTKAPQHNVRSKKEGEERTEFPKVKKTNQNFPSMAIDKASNLTGDETIEEIVGKNATEEERELGKEAIKAMGGKETRTVGPLSEEGYTTNLANYTSKKVGKKSHPLKSKSKSFNLGTSSMNKQLESDKVTREPEKMDVTLVRGTTLITSRQNPSNDSALGGNVSGEAKLGDSHQVQLQENITESFEGSGMGSSVIQGDREAPKDDKGGAKVVVNPGNPEASRVMQHPKDQLFHGFIKILQKDFKQSVNLDFENNRDEHIKLAEFIIKDLAKISFKAKFKFRLLGFVPMNFSEPDEIVAIIECNAGQDSRRISPREVTKFFLTTSSLVTEDAKFEADVVISVHNIPCRKNSRIRRNKDENLNYYWCYLDGMRYHIQNAEPRVQWFPWGLTGRKAGATAYGNRCKGGPSACSSIESFPFERVYRCVIDDGSEIKDYCSPTFATYIKNRYEVLTDLYDEIAANYAKKLLSPQKTGPLSAKVRKNSASTSCQCASINFHDERELLSNIDQEEISSRLFKKFRLNHDLLKSLGLDVIDVEPQDLSYGVNCLKLSTKAVAVTYGGFHPKVSFDFVLRTLDSGILGMICDCKEVTELMDFNLCGRFLKTKMIEAMQEIQCELEDDEEKARCRRDSIKNFL